MPLSDQVHGPYKMTPPELLHISGSGLIKYMFQTLKYLLSPMFQIIIDALHQRLFQDIARQSEKDFPRGSNRNGILDGTKSQSTENRGNLFLLLCLAHTVAGRRALARIFRWTGSWPPAFLFFHSDLPSNGGLDAQLKHKTESQIGPCIGHARFTRAKSCVSAQKRKWSQASEVPRDDQNGSFYETFW